MNKAKNNDLRSSAIRRSILEDAIDELLKKTLFQGVPEEIKVSRKAIRDHEKEIETIQEAMGNPDLGDNSKKILSSRAEKIHTKIGEHQNRIKHIKKQAIAEPKRSTNVGVGAKGGNSAMAAQRKTTLSLTPEMQDKIGKSVLKILMTNKDAPLDLIVKSICDYYLNRGKR